MRALEVGLAGERSTKRQGLIGMLRENRQFRWLFILAVGLPTLYVASFGPACWISSHLRGSGSTLLVTAYRRLASWSVSSSMPELSSVLQWYARLGARHRWQWGTIGGQPTWLGPGAPDYISVEQIQVEQLRALQAEFPQDQAAP